MLDWSSNLVLADVRLITVRLCGAGEPAVIFVEEADGSALGVLEAPEEVEALMARLNQNGLREKVLHQKLSKRKDAILAALGRYAISLDVSDTPR